MESSILGCITRKPSLWYKLMDLGYPMWLQFPAVGFNRMGVYKMACYKWFSWTVMSCTCRISGSASLGVYFILTEDNMLECFVHFGLFHFWLRLGVISTGASHSTWYLSISVAGKRNNISAAWFLMLIQCTAPTSNSNCQWRHVASFPVASVMFIASEWVVLCLNIKLQSFKIQSKQ